MTGLVLIAAVLAQAVSFPGQTRIPAQPTYMCSNTGCVTRDLTAKLGDSIHIKDFGPKCDGVTDDTTAFANAIAATTTALDITGCSINTTGVTINHPMALISRDPGTTITARSGSTGSIITVTGTHDVFLAGFAIENLSAASNNQDAIVVSTSWAVIVQQVTVNHSKRDAISIQSSQDFLKGTQTFISLNQILISGRHGVFYSTSGNLNVNDNLILGSSNSGVANGGASAFDSQQINIARNAIEWCGGAGVNLTGVLTGGLLDPAAPYSEHVTIADNKLYHNDTYGLEINAQHVTVAGNTLRDNGNYTTITNFINQGIVVTGRYIAITDNIIQRQGGAGIDVGYSSYVTITANIVHDVLGIGIEVNSTRYVTVTGNEISLAFGSSTVVGNYLRSGIAIHGDVTSAIQNSTDQVVVSNNHVGPSGSNQKYGIYVSTQNGAGECTNVYVYGNYTKGAGAIADIVVDAGTNLQALDFSGGLYTLGTNAAGFAHLQAYTGAGQSIPNGAGAIVVFGSVEDDSAAAYNSGTGVYTIPKAGTYEVSASVAFANAQTGQVLIHLRVNGSNIRTVIFVAPGGGQNLQISVPHKLATGDTVSIWIQHSNAGAQSLLGNAVQNFLYVMRMP